jgi:hypothetical protein
MPKPSLYIKLARVSSPRVRAQHWDETEPQINWQATQRPPMPPRLGSALPGFAQFQLFDDPTFADDMLGFIYRSNVRGYGGCIAVYTNLRDRVAAFDAKLNAADRNMQGVNIQGPIDRGPSIPYGAPRTQNAKVYKPLGSTFVFNKDCVSTLANSTKRSTSKPIDLQYAEPGITFLREFFELHFVYPLFSPDYPDKGNGGTPHDPTVGAIVLL